MILPLRIEKAAIFPNGNVMDIPLHSIWKEAIA